MSNAHHTSEQEVAAAMHEADISRQLSKRFGWERSDLVVLADEVARLRDELSGYRRWASSVNEALNTGDGSYRP